MAQLLIQNGTETPVVYELNGEVVRIGRSPENDIVLADASVSAFHAEIVPSENVWLVRDLDSSNGTTRNGYTIREATLVNRDRIGFAGVECQFADDPSRENRRSSTRPKINSSKIYIRGAMVTASAIAAFVALSALHPRAQRFTPEQLREDRRLGNKDYQQALLHESIEYSQTLTPTLTQSEVQAIVEKAIRYKRDALNQEIQ